MSKRPHYGSPVAARLNQVEDERDEARTERDRFATALDEIAKSPSPSTFVLKQIAEDALAAGREGDHAG